MVQTLTRPRETEEGLMGAGIEGMVEVRAEGEGDVPWCGENPQEDPVKGATRLKGKGSGAAIRTFGGKSSNGKKKIASSLCEHQIKMAVFPPKIEGMSEKIMSDRCHHQNG